jgi:SAM-dependent methyltransferase
MKDFSFMNVYDYPLYYEIAFSYQEAKRQADFFEEAAKKFSKIHVKRFLDIACGPSPQLRELARRGYEAVGLDINPRMLTHLKKKAQEEGVKVETVEADMNNFKLKKKCDFAFILSGSLHVGSNRQFMQHLHCVVNALRKGGLYLFENFSLRLNQNPRQEWTMKQGEIEVKTKWEATTKDELEQLEEEKLTLEVNDHGKKKTFTSTFYPKTFAPQELKALIELNGKFEFIGWFEHLKLEPLKTTKGSNIIIIRKK